MTKLKSLLAGLGTIVLISDPLSFAVAQSALNIGENDNVFIDRSGDGQMGVRHGLISQALAPPGSAQLDVGCCPGPVTPL